jgi:hypothetical protein
MANATKGGAQAPDRTRKADARVLAWVLGILIHAHERAEARDEHRRAGANSQAM